MKNFTRAKKIGNEDFQQNGNVLGVSGTIETNVLRLWEVADLISEFSPKPQTKLIKRNIQLLQNPQFLKAVVTCQAQNGIFFFFLFLDKFPFKLFPRNPAQILRNPFPTIFYGLQLRKILKNVNKKRKKKKMRLQLRHISVAFSQRRLQVTLGR